MVFAGPLPHLEEHRTRHDGQSQADRRPECITPATASPEPRRQARELSLGTPFPAVRCVLAHRFGSGELTGRFP